MTALASRERALDTESLLDRRRPAISIIGWLTNPAKYIQEIEKTEMLLDRLIFERELLLNYSKAVRSWAYEALCGKGSLDGPPRDLMLLEAMNNLPEHLREEIQGESIKDT
jgi:hypothetical protein